MISCKTDRVSDMHKWIDCPVAPGRGHNMFLGSFNSTTLSFCHIEGEGGATSSHPLKGRGRGLARKASPSCLEGGGAKSF